MQRMCKVCGDWHDLDEPWPAKCRGNSGRSSAPYVISDTMQPLKHMGTGEVLDSKAKFRQATKASGCVELGNESIKPRAPIKLDSGKRREDIQKTIYHLRNGY
jgi:hypothetical protein